MDKKKIILIAVGIMFFLYVDYEFILRSRINSINSAKIKIANYEKQINKLARDLADMEALKEKQLAENKKAQNLKVFIKKEELSHFMEKISLVAGKNSVRIMQMQHSLDTKDAQDPMLAGQKVSVFAITLDILGQYHNIGMFLNSLENENTITEISNLRILPESINADLEKAKLILKVYVQED